MLAPMGDIEMAGGRQPTIQFPVMPEEPEGAAMSRRPDSEIAVTA